MGKINRPPIGLQSLLGSVNFGVNPNELFETVRPTIDLFPFWAQQQLRLAQETGNSAGAGNIVEIEVPKNEIWLPLSVRFARQITVLNDDPTLRINLDETLAGVTNFTVASAYFKDYADPNEFADVIWTPPVPFWLPSGYLIKGEFQSSQPLAAANFELDVVYYTLQV